MPKKSFKPYGYLEYSKMPTAKKAVSIAKKALTIARKGEMKYSDQSIYNAVATVNTGDIQCLSLIAQGDSATTRDGNHITAMSLRLHYDLTRISQTATTGSLARRYRLIVFKDKVSDGTAPTVAEVLISADVHSPLKPENKKRFTVLVDKLYTMGPYQVPATADALLGDPLFATYRATKKIKNVDIVYTGNTATLADANINHYYVLTINDDAANAAYHTLRSTLYFKDA